MSWMSSLAMDLSAELAPSATDSDQPTNKLKQNFYRSLLICGSFILIFSFLGFPSVWAPIIGLLFSPILELVLFPLALIGTLSNTLAFVFDFTFMIATYLLSLLGADQHFLFFLRRETVVHLNLYVIVLLIAVTLKLKKVKT